MDAVQNAIAISMLAEATWEIFKESLPVKLSARTSKLGVLLITIVLTVVTQTDALASLELPGIMGAVLTGVICSRGSNFLHDIIGMLNKNKA